ncbi:MAG: NPCBM/NEW2 domain-containing protein, partial [Candidatus Poribacteria bacterium]|nr:NPCBM/NEW2 domain-containing protein [Candidatus Poribacteria bacterium]
YSSKRKPSYDKSYSQQPLKLRGKNYTKGIGVEAPSHLLYNIQSKYDCLVGIAGLDESMLENESGRARAMYPSVILKIYINGKSVNESPILRISQEPWRFEVKLLADSQTISLVAIPSHTNSYENFVNWVNVGFLVKQ